MFDVGLPEFFVLGVVALLVFGPERLPEVAVQAARLIRRLRGMAESARNELTADLEPHMRELRELRELDPRKMAKRYVLDPVEEDGTLAELRGKGLRGKGLRGSGRSGKKLKTSARPAAAATAAAGAADGLTSTGSAVRPGESVVEPATTTNGTASPGAGALGDGHQTNGSTSGPADDASVGVPAAPGPALPPAMAPVVTPAGQRPAYDVDAT